MLKKDIHNEQFSEVDAVQGLLNDQTDLYDFLKAHAEAEKMSIEGLVVQLIRTYKEWVDEDEAEREQQESNGEIIRLHENMNPETPKRKAREFFEALIEKDFERAYTITLRNFRWLNLEQSDYYSNVIRIVTIGEPYKKGNPEYANGKGIFVPYEIELANGKIRRGAIAMRCDNPDRRSDIPEDEWVFDGGL